MTPFWLGAGLAVGFLVAPLDDRLLLHMIQHLGLTAVAAPLLVLGAPAPAILRRLPRRVARRALRLAHPLAAWLLFVGSQWAVHFTGAFDYADAHAWAHALEHGVFLGTAALFWWPVLGSPPRLEGAGRVLYVLLAMPAVSAVGIVLLDERTPRYSAYSLADQQAAGALMWSVGSLLMAAALVVGVWQWLQREERRARTREAYGR